MVLNIPIGSTACSVRNIYRLGSSSLRSPLNASNPVLQANLPRMPLIPLVAIAVALVCPPFCLADPSAIHSPQSSITTKASAGASRDNSTADILSKTFLPKETRDKKLLHRTSISMQNVNGLGTDAKIREACKTVRENRIPCTIVLETHRCFDQCLELRVRQHYFPWPRVGEREKQNQRSRSTTVG